MTHPFITDAEATQKIQQSYKQLERQLEAIAGGSQGAISISDTPTEIGYYYPTESGTYTNAGGLVVDLTEGITILIYDGTDWDMQVVPIDLTPTGVVEEGNTQAVSGGEVFDVLEPIKDQFSTIGLNVSELFPTGGVDGGYRYDLEGAILKVQDEYGHKEGFPWGGIAISFIDVSTRKAVCYINNESDGTFYPERFSNINNWRYVDINKGSQVYEDLGARGVEGKYIALNYSVGTVVDLTPIDEVIAHSHLRYAILINMSSTEGDMFELRAFNEVDAKRVYAFLDSDNKILEVAGRYEFTNDTKIIVAPKDTARVIFNFQRNVEGSYIYKVVDPKIKEQNSQILSVRNEQEANQKDVNDKLIKNSATVSLNLSEIYPDKGIDGGFRYNLEHAIDVVKQELGSKDGFPWSGMKISFVDKVTRKLKTYINQESGTIEGFDNIDNWRFIDINKGSQHYLDIGQTGVEGKYIPLNFTVGTVVDLTPQDSTYAHSHEEYTVLIDANAQEGDMFELRSWNDRDIHRVYAFLDSDNRILEVATRYFYVEDTHLLVAPKGTTRVLFNYKRNVQGSYIYKVVDARINNINKRLIEGIKPEQSAVKNLLDNSDFSDGIERWTGIATSLDSSGNVVTGTVDSVNPLASLAQANTFVVGNVYYISYYINPFRTHYPQVRIGAYNTSLTEAQAGVFTKITALEKLSSARPSITFYYNGRSEEDMEVGSQVSFRDLLVINLTELFGEGEEPTKEQFEMLLDLLPYDWFKDSVPLKDWQLALTRYMLKGGFAPSPEDTAFGARITSILMRKKGDEEWVKAFGIARLVPDTDRVVHTVELTELEEDTEYEFRLLDLPTPTFYTTINGDPSDSQVVHWHTFQPHPASNYQESYSSDIKQLKTFPKVLTGNMRFGHMTDTHGFSEAFADMAARDVRCIIHSGDIASGNGGELSPASWYLFFNSIVNAIDSSGNIIPFLANLGNHEIWAGNSGMEWSSEEIGVKPNFTTNKRGDAEWYYCFFPTFPGLRGYGAVHFGNYASIFQLDPGITTYVEGEQTEWLKREFIERQDVPHKIVSFHYSLFQNGRRRAQSYYNVIRQAWAHTFEENKALMLAGHSHVSGKTVPILSGDGAMINSGYEDPEGIVYLVAASGNVNTPQPARNPNTKWWLDTARGSVWGYFDFEQEDYDGPEFTKENRPPHATDGTTFETNKVLGWWEIEIENTKRTMRYHNLDKEMVDEFVQDSLYLGL